MSLNEPLIEPLSRSRLSSAETSQPYSLGPSTLDDSGTCLPPLEQAYCELDPLRPPAPDRPVRLDSSFNWLLGTGCLSGRLIAPRRRGVGRARRGHGGPAGLADGGRRTRAAGGKAPGYDSDDEDDFEVMLVGGLGSGSASRPLLGHGGVRGCMRLLTLVGVTFVLPVLSVAFLFTEPFSKNRDRQSLNLHTVTAVWVGALIYLFLHVFTLPLRAGGLASGLEQSWRAAAGPGRYSSSLMGHLWAQRGSQVSAREMLGPEQPPEMIVLSDSLLSSPYFSAARTLYGLTPHTLRLGHLLTSPFARPLLVQLAPWRRVMALAQFVLVLVYCYSVVPAIYYELDDAEGTFDTVVMYVALACAIIFCLPFVSVVLLFVLFVVMTSKHVLLQLDYTEARLLSLIFEHSSAALRPSDIRRRVPESYLKTPQSELPQQAGFGRFSETEMSMRRERPHTVAGPEDAVDSYEQSVASRFSANRSMPSMSLAASTSSKPGESTGDSKSEERASQLPEVPTIASTQATSQQQQAAMQGMSQTRGHVRQAIHVVHVLELELERFSACFFYPVMLVMLWQLMNTISGFSHFISGGFHEPGVRQLVKWSMFTVVSSALLLTIVYQLAVIGIRARRLRLVLNNVSLPNYSVWSYTDLAYLRDHLCNRQLAFHIAGLDFDANIVAALCVAILVCLVVTFFQSVNY